jgi:hypothetical protein
MLLKSSEERIQRFGHIAVMSVRMEMAGSSDGWRIVAGHVSAVLVS